MELILDHSEPNIDVRDNPIFMLKWLKLLKKPAGVFNCIISFIDMIDYSDW